MYPTQFGNATADTDERPAWRDFWKELYEYYTVLGCEYEIICYNPLQLQAIRLNNIPSKTINSVSYPAVQVVQGAGYYNTDCVCAVQYDTYSSTEGATGNVMPLTYYEEVRAYKNIKWYPIPGGQKTVIKGVYKPGDAKRNIANDGDVKTWTKTSTGAPTTLQEILTLNFWTDPFFNARRVDSYYTNSNEPHNGTDPNTASAMPGVVEMEIKLKYIVQFKDLRQQARYPNTITTDTDRTIVLNESNTNANGLQRWA